MREYKVIRHSERHIIIVRLYFVELSFLLPAVVSAISVLPSFHHSVCAILYNFAVFEKYTVSQKNAPTLKKQTYTKTEAYKLYSRVF